MMATREWPCRNAVPKSVSLRFQAAALLHSQHFQYDQHFCFKDRVLFSAVSCASIVTSPPSRYIRCSSTLIFFSIFLSAYHPSTTPMPKSKVVHDKNRGM